MWTWQIYWSGFIKNKTGAAYFLVAFSYSKPDYMTDCNALHYTSLVGADFKES